MAGALSALAIAAAIVGYFWVAYLVWKQGSRVDAIVAFLVPCPLLGLIFWQRFKWAKSFRWPAALYIGGSAFEIALRVIH
jgi:hypothetical protein